MVSSLERFPCDVLKYTYKKGQNVTRESLDSMPVLYKRICLKSHVSRKHSDSQYKHKKELAVRPLYPSKAYILRLGLIQTHIRHMKKIPLKRDFFH